MARRQPMKPLRRAIDDYIALRRSLGFKLRDMADDLPNWATFLEQKAAPLRDNRTGNGVGDAAR
jgi:hypothetical protein